MSGGWTRPTDVTSRVRARWLRGEFLSAWAQDQPFVTLRLPLRGPSTTELSTRFDEVREWLQAWSARQPDGVEVLTRTVGHRTIGANTVPARLEIRGYDALWSLLGVTADVRRFAELRDATLSPALVSWMNSHPMTVLAHSVDWSRLVRTVDWIAATPDRHRRYLREVPVPGVDTKFIEGRRGILADLLDCVLPATEIRAGFPPSQFERRYGLAEKPGMIRLRSLDRAWPLVPRVQEMVVRLTEFPAIAPDAGTVFIVENEITYLAFPDVADTVVVFGGGFAVSSIAPLPWLRGRRVVYWGDIDTHGFVALDRLRAQVPHASSMLMDRETLFAHPDQWARESTPTAVPLPHLTDAESALYQELVNNAHGAQVRLEQERVGYPLVRFAIAAVIG